MDKYIDQLNEAYNDCNQKLFMKTLRQIINTNKSRFQYIFKSPTLKYEMDVLNVLTLYNIEFIQDDFLIPNVFEVCDNPESIFDLEAYRNITGFFDKADNFDVEDSFHEMYYKMKESIVGQDELLKTLISTIMIHTAGLNVSREYIKPQYKPAILLQGATGVGKTYTLKTLCKENDIPYVHFDSSRLTADGYVGSSIQDIMFQYLIEKHQYPDAPIAIIHLDEIDKLCIQSEDKTNVGTYGAQRNLLSLLEEDVYRFDADMLTKFKKVPASLDMGEVLFILSGSFSLFTEQKVKNTIGFNSPDKEEDNVFYQDKLVKAGIMPELAGRMGQVIQLNELKDEDMLHILKYCKNNLISQLDLIASNFRGEFNLKDSECLELIKKSKKLKLGARGLKSLVQERFSKHMVSHLSKS